MALTPLHPGPALLLGGLFPKFFNFWALFLGSVLMDLESLILAITKCGGLLETRGCANHGFFHSILGAIFGSLVIAFILSIFREKLNNLSLKFKIKQLFSFPVLFFSALAAWLIHIFFDSLSHFDVFLFWPLEYNPFLIGPAAYRPLNFILLTFFIIALVVIIKKRNRYD